MRTAVFKLCGAAAAPLLLLACGGPGVGPPPSTLYGPDPQLPPPEKSFLLPTVNIAPAEGWPQGAAPTPAQDLQVASFATDLDHPRWIYVLPNGDVLVAESNAPPKETRGLRDWIMGMMMKSAGAGVPSANRITLLRDADGDGRPEVRSTFLQGLHSPFGMALVDDQFYVANADALVRFPYVEGDLTINAAPVTLAELPAGLNHHWTKNVVASADGSRLYVTVGSNSNVGENGMDIEVNRAAILEVDRETGETRLFASGLRNPNGMGWEPRTGELWTVVNERDEIGDNLVPDYLTSVRAGAFYGWPYSYFGQIVDERVQPQRPDLVARAVKPDYALGPHTASLGLTFYDGQALPARYQGGAFIGQHGSWNRSSPSGYKVVFVPFEGGRPSTAPPQDILTGFLNADEEAMGRPVGVVVDGRGALLVADDVGNRIWRVTARPGTAPSQPPATESAPD
jgi:glucose/arabinose dehydrogenase